MKLSPLVAEWAEAYEQKHGHKPAELLIQVAEHITKVSDMLRERGRADAQQSKTAYPADTFPRLVVKAFRLELDTDHDMVQAVADLWHDDYMDGYNAWKEVRSA